MEIDVVLSFLYILIFEFFLAISDEEFKVQDLLTHPIFFNTPLNSMRDMCDSAPHCVCMCGVCVCEFVCVSAYSSAG